MPSRYKLRLLSHLRHDSYTPRDIAALAEDLGIDEEDMPAFKREVYELLEDEAIVMDGQLRIDLPPIEEEVIGRIRLNPRGFAFVIPEDANAQGDLFIPAGSTLDAVTGDTVRAAVYHRRGRVQPGHSPFIGEVVEIIRRGRDHFTGTLVHRAGVWLIEPDGNILHGSVTVRDPSAKNARDGDKVVFELLTFPEGRMSGEAVITEVLGEAGEPDVETAAVIRAYGLPGEFPEEVLEQTREVTREFESYIQERLEREKRGEGPAFPEREDLRDSFICTIDPPDAKDFDDAISLEKKGDGYVLGVHIADVANFIPPGSPLDEEAKLRGNSVYLPRLVIPMLPELLSNGICSLQEAVPRFTKSVFITFDRDGYVQGARYSNAVIQSVKRMTYLEAQALIDGKPDEARKHARTDAPHTPRLIETVRMMNELARRIRKRREKKGMISLELPDVELIFDDQGRVVDVVPEDNAFTHTIIEMFMVEANEAVARLFDSLNIPIIRRLHP
ncbi:MAG TPA: RNB domain-containing ribonuclease, partial [Phycisphaeraceae bacterium]|nr:RNB domain-containing ribonuclease [Phycisphaeraceae bacterium]